MCLQDGFLYYLLLTDWFILGQQKKGTSYKKVKLIVEKIFGNLYAKGYPMKNLQATMNNAFMKACLNHICTLCRTFYVNFILLYDSWKVKHAQLWKFTQ